MDDKQDVNVKVCLKFEPKDDMTPVEAAWIAVIMAQYARTGVGPEYFSGWDIIKRHFTEA
jgi:hypothetical protein